MVLDFRLPAGQEPTRQPGNECALCWEITRKCKVGCKHCCLAGRRSRMDISFNDCLEIVTNFRKFLWQNNLIGQITFTGGDPLLRADFLDILEITNEYHRSGIINQIGIAGNPSQITPGMTQKLKAGGISRYALSLDGLEKTHDYLRKAGSFKQTLYALRCLRESGIITRTHFTLSRLNAAETADCLRLAATEGAGIFSFRLLMPIGQGVNLKSEFITPREYRAVLFKIIELFDESPDISVKFSPSLFASHPLFARAYYELGRREEYQKIINRPDYFLLVSKTKNDHTVNIGIHCGEQIKPGFFQEKYEIWKRDISKRKPETFDEFVRCRECPVGRYCGKMVRLGYCQDNILNPMCWVE